MTGFAECVVLRAGIRVKGGITVSPLIVIAKLKAKSGSEEQLYEECP